MKFTDTYELMLSCFQSGKFSLDDWRRYINQISPTLQEKVENDTEKYSFESAVLPVVKAALENQVKLEMVHNSFQSVSEFIQRRFTDVFHEDLDVEIILYLGLCSGAGWATTLDGKRAVLLGVEKIIELDWGNPASLFALISHEIGHIWHMKAGGQFDQQDTKEEEDIFQLYSEGVAMLCEHMLCGKDRFYHQNRDGWLEWCENNLEEIKREYRNRVENALSVQDFFGDWCSYRGYSDVGYFLGRQFVAFLLEKYELKRMACLENQELQKEFYLFTK